MRKENQRVTHACVSFLAKAKKDRRSRDSRGCMEEGLVMEERGRIEAMHFLLGGKTRRAI